MATGQAPYFYRFKHGTMQGTVISDGILPLGEPSASFLGTSKEEVGQMLTSNFLDPSNVVLEQNILVVNTGSHLVLFDTGMGQSKIFGPTTGQMMHNLEVAGIDPASIDAILCTHAHCDHVWGIMADDGQRNFPNAQIYISQADFEFWTDEAKLTMTEPGYMKPFVEGARKNLLPNRDRIVFFKDGEEFLPGIQAMSAPGHTVGHTMFLLTSDGQTMAAIGDTTHHHVLLLEKPLMEFAYDTDPQQSAQTRYRVLDMLAAERMPMIAYHFPWPGIGHIAKQGEGFRYFPAPMVMQELPG
ncbi:MBL fold metallo-hydrolase [Nisaea acidiphila]|uniref:MBL fold metallo-hydrolase n=1 Tax=Nisaea acidiphila TaxID=1862145 RepID=A0A9J7ARD7_9PROT|nr:MBL fold metallo-hydrolase [Nisaea acidiphila]UUX48908.1 MBL fold metallo-hydrolase [Nisaea acidiphila]